MLSPEQKNLIIQRLQSKGANAICPRCYQNSWSLADDYIMVSMQPMSGGVVLGGPSIPSIGVICANCGYISLHAIGALGFSPAEGVK